MLRWMVWMTWGVMVLGSLVRATGSGLACPDWPLCFGKPIPYFDTQIFLEWFHRLVAGLLCVVTVSFAVKVLLHRQHREQLSWPLGVGLAVLAWQVILGALTVLQLLNPGVVSWHLINAVIFLGILIWMRERIVSQLKPWQSTDFAGIGGAAVLKGVALALAVSIFAQIFLGGMVSTSHAGLMCPDFPTCYGQWWPQLGAMVALQMSHRFMGFFIVALALFLVLSAQRIHLPQHIRKGLSALPPLVALQILLGALNVAWKLPTGLSVAHLALALILFMISTQLVIRLYAFRSETVSATQVLSREWVEQT